MILNGVASTNTTIIITAATTVKINSFLKETKRIVWKTKRSEKHSFVSIYQLAKQEDIDLYRHNRHIIDDKKTVSVARPAKLETEKLNENLVTAVYIVSFHLPHFLHFGFFAAFVKVITKQIIWITVMIGDGEC